MKKIAVQTFWTSQFNYGQVLQGYALQRFLRNNGFDAYIIRFDSILSRLKERLIIILKGKLLADYKQRKLRHFDDFKKRNILYSKKFYGTFRSLQNTPPPANYYIVGSDQVWAYMRNAERRNGYLLRFGKDVKKLAYAASFGRNELEANEINDYADALKEFAFVGVREQSGLSICNKLNIESSWVIDPVALLTADEWKRVASPISIEDTNQKKMFLYTLTSSQQNSSICKILEGFSERYSIYYANSSELFDERMNTSPTIEEWIAYIDKCDCVVTDSFHCTLFCIILQKNFVTIKRHGGERMNNRLISLLDRLNLLSRYVDTSVDNIKDTLDTAIDWKLVNAELSSWRRESSQLLLNELR